MKLQPKTLRILGLVVLASLALSACGKKKDAAPDPNAQADGAAPADAVSASQPIDSSPVHNGPNTVDTMNRARDAAAAAASHGGQTDSGGGGN